MDFETLAAKLGMTDEDREVILTVAGKYSLDDAVVDKKDFEAASQKLQAWEAWKDTAWDPEHQMTRAQWASEQTIAQLQSKLASGIPGGNMTFEELENHLKTNGYVRKDALDGIKAEVSTTIAKTVDQNNMGNEFVFTRATPMLLRYSKEFGTDDFDLEAFVQFALAGGDRYIKDPATGQPVKRFDAAYDAFVAEKRMALKQAELEKRSAELKEQEAALETRRTQVSSPTDDGRGGTTAMPRFKRHILGLDKDETPVGGDAPLGSGVTAAQAWELYKQGELQGVNKPN